MRTKPAHRRSLNLMLCPSAQIQFFLKTSELIKKKKRLWKIFPKNSNLANEVKALIEIKVRIEERHLDR